MRIKSQADFFSGVMFTTVGAAFAIGATTYNIGDGARMGPGYFPLMLGILLAILGALVMFQSLVVETVDGDPIGKWAWKPLFFVIAANLAFGVLLGGLPSVGVPAMGMIIAIYALVIISSLAGEHFKLRDVLILSTILAAGSYVAFIWALKLQIQVWPTFISG
ncbi:tripartite tricarboxylate transporter TctB family protein [Variovorax saccharolyticus]|uniref:tripartite tricarboxylate transporter TctB family protein n=1 Tax=Variovorax saccharolyticus TaxID=3053516 RepID=UPI002576B4FE|nr:MULTISPECIES: tripartite tricarboxylate transporter TctB family protein [unclassified Variovorax]MDM0017512.1 tripartite tricarboxylate transporter TctB family protein [Variovorax sp. J22R187]MDM0028631.1 tripartite tricarboxylate transporter TctB family protein [Variovorax sp. J31P216]